jgi:hypothetical protein
MAVGDRTITLPVEGGGTITIPYVKPSVGDPVILVPNDRGAGTIAHKYTAPQIGDPVVVLPLSRGGTIVMGLAAPLIAETYLMAIESLGNGVILIASRPDSGWGRLHRSTNGGDTFTSVSMESIINSGTYPGTFFNIIKNLGGGVVLACTTSQAGTHGQIWRSTDYGVTWTLVHELPAVYYVGGVIVHEQQAFYVDSIAVSGSYLYAIDTWSKVVIRSTDNGLTWDPIFDLWSLIPSEAAYILKIAVSAAGIVACSFGDYGDIYISTNHGVSFAFNQRLGYYTDSTHYKEMHIDLLGPAYGSDGNSIFAAIREVYKSGGGGSPVYYSLLGAIADSGRGSYVGSGPSGSSVGRGMCYAVDGYTLTGVAYISMSGIFRTTDLWASSTLVKSIPSYPLTSGITHTSSTTMFYINYYGEVWKSTDTGVTWAKALQLYRPS